MGTGRVYLSVCHEDVCLDMCVDVLCGKGRFLYVMCVCVRVHVKERESKRRVIRRGEREEMMGWD